jgi:hypothetical protein
MEKSKGSKASNIYQVLKGAGAWQSKDSKGPMIKGVGIKSPLNLMSDKATLDKYKDKLQSKKNEKARSEGKAVSYKDAYADADKKKYKTYEEFEKAAKDWNKKKYETENPTSEAKKQNISKEQLAKNVADKNKKAETTETTTTTTTTDTPKEENIKSTDVTVKSRKQLRNEKRAKKLSDKAKEKGSLTKGQQRRLAVAEEKAAGKSGKDARLAANEKLNPKDESVAVMNKKNKNKSAMKMAKKKTSPIKLDPPAKGAAKSGNDPIKDLNKKNLTESLTKLGKKYPKTAEALKNAGITADNAPEKIEDAGKKVLKKGYNMLTNFMSKINK